MMSDDGLVVVAAVEDHRGPLAATLVRFARVLYGESNVRRTCTFRGRCQA